MNTHLETNPEDLVRWLGERRMQARLLGEGPAFLQAIRQLPAISKTDGAVLVSGETGTGKELVARTIHDLSGRADAPFVAVNCGSLAETLLEDELFGHERGAFTDAHRHRPGLIVEAEKGTLFLDEVDSLTAKAQVMLLRVLQERRFRRLGASHEQSADVRIIAATNVRLEQLVRLGTFRVDLYYRLHVFSIRLPPLRQRTADIMPLAAHFLKKHTPSEWTPRSLTPGAVAALMAFDWPGNVRELESAIVRGIHLSTAPVIEEGDLELEPRTPWWPGGPTAASTPLPALRTLKREVIEVFEKDYLTRLLSLHGGNLSRAARTAGKERRELGKLIKKYGIEPETFRPAGMPGASPGQPDGDATIAEGLLAHR